MTAGLYLGILTIVGSLIRTGAWIAVLVALFGWRPVADEKLAPARWQFSILGLLGLTLAVAVLCGVARWLVIWLGESAAHLLQLVDDIPIFVCWLVGLAVAIRSWRQHPSVSLGAVLGIGLIAAIALTVQVGWLVLVTTSGYVEWVRILDVLITLVASAAWCLIIAAALRDREPDHQRLWEPSP
jgi:hypothetical protein